MLPSFARTLVDLAFDSEVSGAAVRLTRAAEDQQPLQLRHADSTRPDAEIFAERVKAGATLRNRLARCLGHGMDPTILKWHLETTQFAPATSVEQQTDTVRTRALEYLDDLLGSQGEGARLPLMDWHLVKDVTRREDPRNEALLGELRRVAGDRGHRFSTVEEWVQIISASGPTASSELGSA